MLRSNASQMWLLGPCWNFYRSHEKSPVITADETFYVEVLIEEHLELGSTQLYNVTHNTLLFTYTSEDKHRELRPPLVSLLKSTQWKFSSNKSASCCTLYKFFIVSTLAKYTSINNLYTNPRFFLWFSYSMLSGCGIAVWDCCLCLVQSHLHLHYPDVHFCTFAFPWVAWVAVE